MLIAVQTICFNILANICKEMDGGQRFAGKPFQKTTPAATQYKTYHC